MKQDFEDDQCFLYDPPSNESALSTVKLTVKPALSLARPLNFQTTSMRTQEIKIMRTAAIITTSLLLSTLGCDDTGLEGTQPSQMGAAGESMPQVMPLPEPVDGCNGVIVDDNGVISAAESVADCATCPGATPPSFSIQDLNPTSCGYRRAYGLDVFSGRVTFVVLLRSTCGYCHAQLEKLEQMRFELLALGHELQLVVINQRGTEGTVSLLTERTQAPILQDLESVSAWESLADEDTESPTGLKGGDKDDMYIYGSDGRLVQFLDDDDPSHSLNLSTEEGYEYLKTALLEVFASE